MEENVSHIYQKIELRSMKYILRLSVTALFILAMATNNNNPFNIDYDVKKVIDESSRSENQMKELLANNTVQDENEWYVLFENGTLVKKGRSSTPTSDYLIGKKFKSISNYYGN